MEENEEKKEKKEKKKHHHDVGRMVTRIIAAFVAFIMIAATAGTIVYYFVYAM